MNKKNYKRKLYKVMMLAVSIFWLLAVVHSLAQAEQKQAQAGRGKEDYTEATDLPFEAENLVIEKGGGYSEKMEKDGVKPSCSGISLKALKLGDREIALRATAVTSDCLIETKDYGNLRIKVNFVTYSYSILVTPKQEALFKKLAPKKQ